MATHPHVDDRHDHAARHRYPADDFTFRREPFERLQHPQFLHLAEIEPVFKPA
jgi:hypothetical protein